MMTTNELTFSTHELEVTMPKWLVSCDSQASLRTGHVAHRIGNEDSKVSAVKVILRGIICSRSKRRPCSPLSDGERNINVSTVDLLVPFGLDTDTALSATERAE